MYMLFYIRRINFNFFLIPKPFAYGIDFELIFFSKLLFSRTNFSINFVS